jgi:ferric-dicitrate binding protein FerR (iron transport regulator)
MADDRFDDELEAIRNESIGDEQVEAAAGRVWQRIQERPIQGCPDFQALLPDYRAGSLPPARKLLLEDHLRECVVCRKVAEGRVTVMPARRAPAPVWRSRWAVAAGMVAVVAAASWFVLRPSGGRITVASLDGAMYQVKANRVAPVAAGAQVAGGGEVRTGKDSGAVIKLSDGSTVEVRERSSFTVSESGGDVTLHLDRGAVIVEAAKRRFGHLYVATRDCTVAVTGTVFSVNAGVKGSRVAVIEGEVRVARGDEQKVLKAGEQYATDASMTPVEIREEIAWSKNVDKHVALIREFSALEKKLAGVRLPDLRYSSRLVSMLPADTALVVSIPNVGEALAESRRLIEQQAGQSPELKQWLDSARNKREFIEAMELLQSSSGYLGSEIILAAAADAKGKLTTPLLLAETTKPGFEEYLNAKLRAAGAKEEVRVSTRGNIVALGDKASGVENLTGGFAATTLGSRLMEVYRGGAGLVVAVDLERLSARPQAAKGEIRQAVLEQRVIGGKTDTHATVYFRDSRGGPAGWLAAPAPIGALDFVSPEASLATAFVVKNPERILEEIAETNPKIPPEIRELAASLGGEFAFALDGSGFPLMTWKVAAEVYNPERMQATIESIIARVNQEAERKGKQGIHSRQQVANGRTYYLLSLPEASQFGEAAYTFLDGYFVAGANRVLVDRAIQFRSSGYTLVRSAEFAQLSPSDRQHQLLRDLLSEHGPTLGPAGRPVRPGAEIKPEHKQAIQQFAGELKPMLVTVCGEGDRITVASSSSLLGLTPARLAGLPGPMAMMELLGQKTGTRKR